LKNITENERLLKIESDIRVLRSMVETILEKIESKNVLEAKH